MNDFKGRCAIVTGAASGIGRACVLQLAAGGSRVGVADCNAEGVHGVVREIASRGGSALPLVADLRHADEVERIVAAAMSEWSRIDILVNAAGKALRMPVLDTDMASWSDVMDTNLTSCFRCSEAASYVSGQTIGVDGGFTAAGLLAARDGIA